MGGTLARQPRVGGVAGVDGADEVDAVDGVDFFAVSAAVLFRIPDFSLVAKCHKSRIVGCGRRPP